MSIQDSMPCRVAKKGGKQNNMGSVRCYFLFQLPGEVEVSKVSKVAPACQHTAQGAPLPTHTLYCTLWATCTQACGESKQVGTHSACQALVLHLGVHLHHPPGQAHPCAAHRAGNDPTVAVGHPASRRRLQPAPPPGQRAARALVVGHSLTGNPGACLYETGDQSTV